MNGRMDGPGRVLERGIEGSSFEVLCRRGGDLEMVIL